MAGLKTQPGDGDVDKFLASVEPDQRREDAIAIREMMTAVTGEAATLWSGNIIGFGSYTYRYASGREGTWFLTGFSPRKQNLTLYIMSGFDAYDDLLSRLGKHKTGKSCLYIKRLEDVDLAVLRALVQQSAAHVAASNATDDTA